MHPGHPLMLSMSDMILEQHQTCFAKVQSSWTRQTRGTEPWLLLLLTHQVKSGDGSVLSKRLQFCARGSPRQPFLCWMGTAPRLEPLPESERSLLKAVLTAPWIATDQEGRGRRSRCSTLVPEHYK